MSKLKIEGFWCGPVNVSMITNLIFPGLLAGEKLVEEQRKVLDKERAKLSTPLESRICAETYASVERIRYRTVCLLILV